MVFAFLIPYYTQARTHAYLKTWKHHLYITWGSRENTYATSLSLPLWVVVHGSKEALTLFLSVLCNNYPCAIFGGFTFFLHQIYGATHKAIRESASMQLAKAIENASGLEMPINDLWAIICNMPFIDEISLLLMSFKSHFQKMHLFLQMYTFWWLLCRFLRPSNVILAPDFCMVMVGGFLVCTFWHTITAL